VDLLGPCGAFTESSRPLTSLCHRQAHPSRNPFRPMCCPIVNLSTLRPPEAYVELTCWSEDRASPWWLRPRRAIALERLLSCWKPASFHPQAACCENCLDPLNLPAPFRLLSIRAPASGGATDFFLASALFDHHPTLRSTGEEDARCAQPTSATQTNYVHPHLARSRLTPQLSLRGCPTETKAPYDLTGDPDVSRRPISLRRTVTYVLTSSSNPSRAGDTSVGVFFPRRVLRPSL